MASPLYDALHVAHSKQIGDPVAAAATNGEVWTSVLRDVHLNDACREWVRKQMEARNFNALNGYKNREAKSLAASILTLSTWTGGVAYILSAWNDTDSDVPVRRMPDGYDALVNSSTNGYWTASATNQFYTVENETFRLMGGTATSSIRLEYIRPHTNLTAGNATDILIPKQYHDEVLKLAFAIAQEEIAGNPNIQVALLKRQMVDKDIKESIFVLDK